MITLFKLYNDIINRGDPRLNNYYLMSSPFQPIAISLLYYWIVRIIGPKFMENRKPFQLTKLLVIYNAFQVILSTYIFAEASKSGWLANNWFECKSVDYSYSAEALRTVHYSWVYYFSKYTELLDTVFFLLRKKYNQISFLHVYHHGSMPVYTWLAVRYAPGGSITFIAFLNSFVHIVMYFYYMVAAMGPQFQKYLGWKKYLTSLQMVQFVLLLIHFVILFFSPECNIPRTITYIFIGNIITNYFLFSNFYKQQYKAKTASTKGNDNFESRLEPNVTTIIYQNGIITTNIKKDY